MAYHFVIVLIDFVEARDVERDDVGIVEEGAEKLIVVAAVVVVAAVLDVKWSEAVLVEEFFVVMK